MYNFPSQYVVTLYFFLVLLLGVRRALYPNIWRQNYQPPRWILLVDCFVSIVRVFCLRVGIHTALGFLAGRHVIYVLLGGFRTFPLLPLHRCIHCVIFLRDYMFLQIIVVSLKSGSWCICQFPYGCPGRNPLRPYIFIFILSLRWRCLYGVSWWSSLMLVCWPLLDNPSYSLL